MKHSTITRAAAAAAVASVLSFAAPALAQSTGQQQTQTTPQQQMQTQQTSGGTQTQTGAGANCTTSSGTSNTTPSTGQAAGKCMPAGPASGPGATMPNGTNANGTNANGMNGSTMNANGGMNGGAQAGPPANMLSDNPNGPNWLQKFDRPRVMATTMRPHRKHWRRPPHRKF